MKKNKKSVLKAFTTLALVFAMVAGITAGFKGKAKAANKPGIYTITFSGGYTYNEDGKIQYGKVKKINGKKQTWESSYSVDYGAGVNVGFPSATNGNYECIGYALRPGADTPVYLPGEVIHACGNITYYAVWKRISVHYFVGETGCYPLTSRGYIYDTNNDCLAESNGTDYNIGGKSYLAGANRVHLDKNNKWWSFTFKGWKAKNRYGQWVDVTGLTIQQALNRLGLPNETHIDVTAVIESVRK